MQFGERRFSSRRKHVAEIGDVFPCFQDFKDKLEKYQDENYRIYCILLLTQQKLTVARARKKQPKRRFCRAMLCISGSAACRHAVYGTALHPTSIYDVEAREVKLDFALSVCLQCLWGRVCVCVCASNVGGVGRNRDSEPISGLTACVNAATARCCKRGRRWTVEHGQRVASYDTSLVVSGGVDCGRRRRNIYDKKPQLTPKTTEQRI